MASSRHRKRRRDLDEPVSLYPLDPEESLRKMLRQPPLDERQDDEEPKEPEATTGQ